MISELLDYVPISCYKAGMRPLHHPAIEDVSVENILYALSDPNRAHIFATIAAGSEPCTCSEFLAFANQVLPKSTLSQHFKVLREAGLIRSERRGVELRNTTRCAEINERYPGLLPAITSALLSQKKKAPGRARTKTGKTRAAGALGRL